MSQEDSTRYPVSASTTINVMFTLDLTSKLSWVQGPTTAFVVLALIAIYVVREALTTNFARIKGIPEVKHGIPFLGHLRKLGGRCGKNDATIYSEWSQEVQSDIYQCRLGNQRTIVVNSWSKMQDLWLGHSSELIDRPEQPGFVDKLGVDITGTSMTDQIRRCRAAAMRALGKMNWPKYYHLVEPTSVGLVRDMCKNGQNGLLPMDVYYHLRHVVFDLALSLTYGARFGEVDNEFMIKFLWSINAISAVRSSTKTYRHFIPLLRWIPDRTSETIRAEKIRAKHVEVLYSSLQERVAGGEDVECVVKSLHDDKLSEGEIHGTCISLLQAAPDTVASGVYQCVAWLSSQEGQSTQSEAYQAIIDAYSGNKDAAWDNAFREEKVPLIVSLYKETLRFFTVTPYATPRRTRADFVYRGAKLPKGITMILNAQQINHDPEHFGSEAWTFKPNRYVGNESPLPHTTYGAGSRICPAVAISNRLFYAILTRLILAFQMKEPGSGTGRRPNIDPLHFSEVYDQLVAHPRFFDCHFVARDALWLESK
ncbi:cytochrome P450 [Teratosphaeria nubilosa]|uniref:Cytochrome P450 n=1 Tax=Teratosphaeria nubilosa TaxID=161662 RepID=A0A6G1L6A0_9PEZI|nr:cytochrome P450 [Teratosphaeria nubilosa]